MKVRDLKAALKALGWYPHRDTGKHEIWSNGKKTISIPRHTNINEFTAQAIIAEANRKNKE